MLSKKIVQLLLILLLAVAFTGTAHATIIDYTYSFALDLNSSNPYGLDSEDTTATISFTIDSSQGYKDSGLSMHYFASDDVFTMSLVISDGTKTYTYNTTDDLDYSSGYYPAATLNTSDWSINTIDFTIDDDLLSTIIVIKAEEEESTGEDSIGATALDYDWDDVADNEKVIAVVNEDGKVELKTVTLDDNGEIITDDEGEPIMEALTSTQFGKSDLSEGTSETSTIPEPATFFLYGVGLFGLAWHNRRRSFK